MSAKSDVYLSPNGYLVFPTRDVWNRTIKSLALMSDDAINSWENGLNFNSSYDLFYDDLTDSIMKSNGSLLNHNTSVQDYLFLRLINANGMVQIENTIYRYVTDSMLLYTLNTQNYKEHYAAFAAGNFNPEYMNRLSGGNKLPLGDTTNFFDYIQNHSFGIAINLTDLNPFHRLGGDVPIYYEIPTDPNDLRKLRMKVKSVYQNLWAYKSVLLKAKCQRKTSSGAWVSYQTHLKVYWDGTRQSTNFELKISGSWNYYTPSSSIRSDNHASKLKWRPYEHICLGKGVKDGKAYATFLYEDLSGSWHTITTPTLTF